MAPVIAVVAKVVTTILANKVLLSVAKFILGTALSIGISKLIAKRAMSRASAGGDGGGRIQLPPSTDNKLPVVYGTAFIGGPIIDAMLSTDQKTMWAVVALAEVTDTSAGSSISFGDVYYDGKLVNFGTNGAVTSLQTNTTPAQIDTRVNGFLDIYLFNNGSSSGVNTGGQTAAQILSITNGVPAAQAWGVNQTMTNCAFAIIKVRYSTDAGTTGIGALTAQLQNTESGQTTGVFRPGSAIKDYMLNERYGCAIPLGRIDTTSLDDLNTYSDQNIDYKPVGWNPGDPYSQQPRYRINGPLDTGQNCLDNLQFLVDSCDSWLQYSELTGLWRVVINQRYPGYPTETGLFLVDSSNLVGGIDISPIDLNDTYNEVEVAYPNTNVKDQTDYQIIDLFTDYPSVLSENEAVNRLNITLPLVNNAVQALYLAARRIFQSREDLVVSFKLDFSGIQLEAGDVIRIDYPAYGWDPGSGFANGKLFRVSSVAEEKDAEGNLFAIVQAFEYNDTIYADDPVQDYVPAFNTGLKDPNVIDFPGAPTITANPLTSGQIASFDVLSYVPDSGLVLYMDFNYGNTSNVQQHILYRTLQQSNGAAFLNSNSLANTFTYANVNVNDLPAGNYYWSVTARNNTSGKRSNSSALYNWTGPNVNPVISNVICNVTAIGNYWFLPFSSNANIQVGMTINKISGIGTLDTTQPTIITEIISPTSWYAAPNVAGNGTLTVACIQTSLGGITGNQVQPNTIQYINIANDGMPLYQITAVGDVLSNPDTYSLPVQPITEIVGNSRVFNYNSPVYVDGTNRNPNYYYPWYQATSSTANGFDANSTGMFAPREATFQELTPFTFNIVDEWNILSLGNIVNKPGYPLDTQEYFEIKLDSQWVSNQDTILQFAPFYQFGLTGNTMYVDSTAYFTYTVPANLPITIDLSLGYDEISTLVDLTDGYNGGGWLVRNIGPTNARAYCLYNLTTFFKGRGI
jgi:hypothetical protein